MRKKNCIVILLSLIVIIFGNSIGVFAEVDSRKEDKELILIDPGHGGYDGGAEVNGVKEKNINLSISLLLKEALVNAGYDVIMTREKDESLKVENSKFKTKKSEDLAARCKIKSDSNCDLFISIHMNIFTESQYFGGQVWYSKYPDSRKLAEIIQRNFKKNIDDRNQRLAKPALDAYKVLRSSDTMPGVIVECGFLSNPDEGMKLNNKEYQKKIAECITMAIVEYFKDKNTEKLTNFLGN